LLLLLFLFTFDIEFGLVVPFCAVTVVGLTAVDVGVVLNVELFTEGLLDDDDDDEDSPLVVIVVVAVSLLVVALLLLSVNLFGC
jgi:hypothetical protein